MSKTGIAYLPLHGGKAPRWLYHRMVAFAKSIADIIIYEKGPEYFIELLSSPYWFQCLTCVLGFDWHSSGTTTVTTAALKDALADANIAVAGGKGKSRQTLDEISTKSRLFDVDSKSLQYISRITAKVDSALVQDGYSLYHHTIFFTHTGKWAVVQQGMNADNGYARRYHWLWKTNTLIEEPHNGVYGIESETLNMTAREVDQARKASVDIATEKTPRLIRQIKKIMPDQITLEGSLAYLHMPRRINWEALKQAYELQPHTYEDLVAIPGIGAATVRALAYTADLIYGTPLSWKDSVKFSFTVGGKDGVPYPVNKPAMDAATNELKHYLDEAKIGKKDKLKAFEQLRKIVPD